MSGKLGRRPIVRDAVERYLSDHAGELITSTQVAQAVYGTADEHDVAAAVAMIARVRRERPGVKVKRMVGYFVERTDAG